jgi:isopenicillin N synthase-like dioxygenase
VPIIDLSDRSSSFDDKAHIIRDAAHKHGFFAVIGCEEFVSQELTLKHQRLQEAFFALPLDKKMEIKVNASHCGYTRIGEETLDVESSTCGDLREGLYFRMPENCIKEHPLQGTNQWPSENDIPEYRKTVDDYIGGLSALGFHLLKLCAVALGFEENVFEKYFTEPLLTLRPLLYQDKASNEAAGEFAAGKHTDYGFLTILYAPQPGLQIWQDGPEWEGWVDIQPLTEGFVINVGDMLEHFTGGFMKSTVHRVVNHRGYKRFSCPFFFEPDYHAQIVPLCGYVGESTNTSAMIYGEYLMSKYRKTHKDFNA